MPRPIAPPESLPGTIGRRRVYLMRHGDVSYFDSEGPVEQTTVNLTKEGQKNAAMMGDLLKNSHFDRAICSGLPRTLQTAKLVLGDREEMLEINPEFKEYRTGNPMALNTWALVEKELIYVNDMADEPGARYARGEVIADFHTKIITAFEKLLIEPGWTTLLLVAHGGVNSVILSWIFGDKKSNSARFEQDPACVNILDFDIIDQQIKRKIIRTLNLTPYNLAKENHYYTTGEELIHSRPKKKKQA